MSVLEVQQRLAVRALGPQRAGPGMSEGEVYTDTGEGGVCHTNHSNIDPSYVLAMSPLAEVCGNYTRRLRPECLESSLRAFGKPNLGPYPVLAF